MMISNTAVMSSDNSTLQIFHQIFVTTKFSGVSVILQMADAANGSSVAKKLL
jgi:hypothetical protein